MQTPPEWQLKNSCAVCFFGEIRTAYQPTANRFAEGKFLFSDLLPALKFLWRDMSHNGTLFFARLQVLTYGHNVNTDLAQIS